MNDNKLLVNSENWSLLQFFYAHEGFVYLIKTTVKNCEILLKKNIYIYIYIKCNLFL